MYIAHPTHGAGTRPNRTQRPTAARKTTLNAGQFVRQPREGRGRTRQPPPPKKKTTEGGGGGAQKQPTATKTPANTTRGGQTPPRKAPKTGPPKRHRGTTQRKQATPSQEQRPTMKRGTKTCRHTPRKKKSQQPSLKERGWRDRDHKARDRDTQQKKKRKKKPKKYTPRQPSQERLGTAETRAQHARPQRTPEQRGASRARTKPHTSHKQAETGPQPRTPQTADTRGTTPQTVPKHTHPRPQPGLPGLTKPTPNHEQDPNTNAAQQ